MSLARGHAGGQVDDGTRRAQDRRRGVRGCGTKSMPLPLDGWTGGLCLWDVYVPRTFLSAVIVVITLATPLTGGWGSSLARTRHTRVHSLQHCCSTTEVVQGGA